MNKKKKLILIDDKRDNPNWGCRGTGNCLVQLIKPKFEIIDVIKQNVALHPSPLGSKFIHKYDEKYFGNRLIQFSSNQKYLKRILNIKKDYITTDPDESMKVFLKNKDRNPILKEIYDKLKKADVFIINGEGSMIFTTPPRRDLLFQLMIINFATSYFHKPVFYVNAMISDCPHTGRNQTTSKISIDLLKKCSGVSLRDQYSVQLASDIDNSFAPEFIPDALFYWFPYFQNNVSDQIPKIGDFIIPFKEDEELFGKLDFNIPYIIIGGSSYAAKFPQKAIDHYVKMITEIKKIGIKIYLVQTCSGDFFLKEVGIRTQINLIPLQTPILLAGAILANAKVFISGRYHPSIFASMGGTPCIFLESNSHKTFSLQKTLGYKSNLLFAGLPEDEDIQSIYALTYNYLNENSKERENRKKVIDLRFNQAQELPNFITDYL